MSDGEMNNEDHRRALLEETRRRLSEQAQAQADTDRAQRALLFFLSLVIGLALFAGGLGVFVGCFVIAYRWVTESF